MTDSQKLLELAKQNNGIITAAMVARAGISRGTLKYAFKYKDESWGRCMNTLRMLGIL